jgi:hypothetical protein
MRRVDEQGKMGRTRATPEAGSGTASGLEVLGLETMRANTARSLRPAARGLNLRCVSGLVVVTQKGDRDDHELRPGDEFRTSSRGLVVAWAIVDSGFIVMKAPEAEGTRWAA